MKSDKLQVFQNEIQEIQLLLTETQTENQITKARLIEYEEISNKNSEKLHEFEVKTQKIRKESNDILELNRKSLKGIEENTIFFEKNPNFTMNLSLEELRLDEELNKLDKVFRNSEVLTKEMQENSAVSYKSPQKNLLKANTPTSKSHKNLIENKHFRSRSIDELNDNHWKKHNKMLSEVYFSTFEHQNNEQILFRNPETISAEGIHLKNEENEKNDMKNHFVESEREEITEKKRRTYSKSKSMQIKDFAKKKNKGRAKSFDSEEKEADLKEKDESLFNEIKEKITGIFGDLAEKTKENGVRMEKEEIHRIVRKLEKVYLKVFEIFERITHQKILRNLELSTHFSKVSDKLKGFLLEKAKFDANLNEILNIFEGKNPNSLDFSERNTETLLLRLRKMIEGFMYDQQQMKSLSFDFSDLIKEKNEIENENLKLKKENQSAITSKKPFLFVNLIKLQ